MHATRIISAAMLLTGLPLIAAETAPAPIVYPQKGQTAAQQQKDSTECAAWAKETTGVDPAALAAAPAVAPAAAPAAAAAPPKGARLKGAAKGAAAGAIVGEVADDNAGDGAAIGAVAGAAGAGRQQRKAAAQSQQQAAQAQQKATADAEAAKQEKLATYGRATSACLEGRGYVVK